MIHQEEYGHLIGLRSRQHIDIGPTIGVIQDRPLAPMHRPPDHRGSIGVSPARGIDTQLATKCIHRFHRRSPCDTCPVTGPWRYIYLGVNACFKDIAIAPHAQAGRTPIGIVMLIVRQASTKDELCPAIGQLAGRAAMKTIHATHIARHHTR